MTEERTVQAFISLGLMIVYVKLTLLTTILIAGTCGFVHGDSTELAVTALGSAPCRLASEMRESPLKVD